MLDGKLSYHMKIQNKTFWLVYYDYASVQKTHFDPNWREACLSWGSFMCMAVWYPCMREIPQSFSIRLNCLTHHHINEPYSEKRGLGAFWKTANPCQPVQSEQADMSLNCLPSLNLHFSKDSTTPLSLSETSPCFYVSAVQIFGKHCGKRRNCLLQAISPLSIVFSTGLKRTYCRLSKTLFKKEQSDMICA